MIFFCTLVSVLLAYGYRSEGCASWVSPLTPFISFLIFSLSAQCVRHFAPTSSNLGSGPTKLTLVIFWNFFFKKKKKKLSLSLKWWIKISSKTLFFNKTSSFLLPGWIFNQRKLFFCCFLMIFFCTLVSVLLAYGYRSEGCASWVSPLTPFISFLIFSLSAQCVRHFAPTSSNLGSWPTKLTLVTFWNFFFKKKKFSLSLKWEIKISSKTLFINKTSSFLLPGWFFN